MEHEIPANISPALRHRMIAEHAYYRVKQRGFLRGDSLAVWLESEIEIEERLRSLPAIHDSKEQVEAGLESEPWHFDNNIVTWVRKIGSFAIPHQEMDSHMERH